MAKGDLTVIDFSVARPFRAPASATRAEVGEPLESNNITLSSGVASANTVVLPVADFPIISTDIFVGICAKRYEVNAAGTVTAHETLAWVPLPNYSRIRGKAETSASVDTDSELLGILWDVTLFDYNSTGGADGGELYTIKEAASADTSALTIVDGNISAGTLDVTVDVRAFRFDVS